MKQINASTLRRNVSGNWLRKEVTEPIEIVSGRKKEPVAVIVPWQTFQLWLIMTDLKLQLKEEMQ
jgi:hypothetical protein